MIGTKHSKLTLLDSGRSSWAIRCLGHHRREFVCRKTLCWRFGIGRCFLWRWCRCLETFGNPSSRSSHFDRHLAGFHLCHCNAGGFLVWFPVQSCLRAHWSLGVFSDTFSSVFGCSMLFGIAWLDLCHFMFVARDSIRSTVWNTRIGHALMGLDGIGYRMMWQLRSTW